jgi:hypothetical protein
MEDVTIVPDVQEYASIPFAFIYQKLPYLGWVYPYVPLMPLLKADTTPLQKSSVSVKDR